MCVLITFVTPESFVKDCNTRTAFCPSTSVLLDHFYQGLRMADTSTRRRVKLYMLNEDRQWDDRGTGHVSSAYVERLRGISLLVRSETDGSILLESRIQTDTAYQKQQETLIVWSEADNYDLALSFQEKAGCDEIWEKICQVQGKDPSVDITQDVVDESEEERFDDMPDAAPPIELPACDLGKLEEIAELFSSVLTSPIRREKLAVAIENEGYIKKLVDLFHMCEDLENLEGLHQLFDILKSIFVLNKNALFEIMFSEDMIFDIVGILEYDPNLPQPARHREYLKKTAKFKEVVPITNPELETKIHQTYRVQYIQDVILPTPSVLEENMLSSLSSFIFFNKVEICSMIQDDEKFLATLFQQLTEEDTDDGHRKDLILFLKEFCTFSQTLQQPSRESFFKILSNLGILSAIEVILGLDDDSVKAAAIDIFSYIVEFSPSMVREFILQESQLRDEADAGHGGSSDLKDDLLINLVIEQMVNDKDPGGAMQLMGILRLLLDPENMMATANKTEKTEFLTFFYKHSMHVLTAPLFANTVDDRPSNDTFPTVQLLSLILELLTFCVEHHTYHIKNYVISKDLLRRVLVLLKSQHSFLALGALRFMRKIIGLKEEFYNRYIVKGNLFHPVVEAFNANGDRYNLLNSAMIELFEFVKVEDVKSLCQHIVENFNEDFAKVKYVKTFESLKLRYDQHQEHVKDKVNDSHSPVIRNNRFRRDARSLEEDEELWFEQDDEMDDSEGPAPMTDILRTTRLDADFDQINKILESKKAKDQAEVHDSPPRLFNKAAPPINIHLRPSANSPLEHGSPGSPGSPNSPGSPASPNPSPNQSPSQSPDHSPDSPSTMPGAPTPNVSPVTTATGASSATPTSSVSVVTKAMPGDSASPAPKKPLVGLVDYPDEDSEEEEDEDMAPSPKKPRLGT